MPTTGLAVLPDIGTITYNSVVFSSLVESSLSGKPIPDNAGRTIKCVEWSLTAKAIVTLPDLTSTSTDSVMVQLRRLLETQGGTLVYTGRGFGQVKVNPASGGGLRDVAWGPIPKLLSFQPLGGGRSADIEWQVTFTIPEVSSQVPPFLQFNSETAVTYDDECYSALSVKGTMEIPMTRTAVNNRVLTQTVDDFRERFLSQVAAGIDLTRYRVTRRSFNVSRDKRTMEWEFLAEELPFMGLPPGTSNARGVFSFRPKKTGVGGVGTGLWICSLRGTYTVIPGQTRRLAWAAFLSLLQFRMQRSIFGVVPGIGNPAASAQNAPPPPAANPVLDFIAGLPIPANLIQQTVIAFGAQRRATARLARKAMLMDIGGDEGLYMDSRTTTFHASWMLMTSLSAIFAATGMWRDGGYTDRNLWAASIKNVSGWTGTLQGRLDPRADVIVDLGFGPPPG